MHRTRHQPRVRALQAPFTPVRLLALAWFALSLMACSDLQTEAETETLKPQALAGHCQDMGQDQATQNAWCGDGSHRMGACQANGACACFGMWCLDDATGQCTRPKSWAGDLIGYTCDASQAEHPRELPGMASTACHSLAMSQPERDTWCGAGRAGAGTCQEDGRCACDKSWCSDCDGRCTVARVWGGHDQGYLCPPRDCTQECVKDACEVCNGDGSSCAGCDGVANSGLVLDECEVCGGEGIPEGECDCQGNVADACGVCGGSGFPEATVGLSATTEGASAEGTAGGYASNMVQVVYDASIFNLKPGTLITGLSFRANDERPHPVAFDDYTVQLSTSRHEPGYLDPEFAKNRGEDLTLVRSGPLEWKESDWPWGKAPNPPGPTIHFDTPFMYAGGDLLLEYTHSPTQGLGFAVDAVASAWGDPFAELVESQIAADGDQGHASLKGGVYDGFAPVITLHYLQTSGASLDCHGVCGGKALSDACGVCGGDGSSCAPPKTVSADTANALP